MLILSENEPPKLFSLDLKKCGGRDPPDITIFLENGALNDILNKEVKSIFIKEVNFWANLIKKVKSIFNKEVNSKKCCFLNDVFNAI